MSISFTISISISKHNINIISQLVALLHFWGKKKQNSNKKPLKKENGNDVPLTESANVFNTRVNKGGRGLLSPVRLDFREDRPYRPRDETSSRFLSMGGVVVALFLATETNSSTETRKHTKHNKEIKSSHKHVFAKK